MNKASTPPATVMMGDEGIKQAYRLMLSEQKLDIVCLTEQYQAVIGDFFESEFGPQLYGKIKTRELLPDTAENRHFAKSKDAQINDVRFAALEQQSNSDCLIGANRAVLISFDPARPCALLIDDQQLVSNLRNQFELAWKAAK